MSNDYEWLRFVDLDRIATDEEREKLMGLRYGCAAQILYKDEGMEKLWSYRFKHFQLQDVLFSFSVAIDNRKMIRFVSDLNVKKIMPPNANCDFQDLPCEDATRCMLIDMGIDVRRPIMDFFRRSRNAARLGAIVAMGAIRSRLRREREMGGWKDISRIIGRLIWESRKYYPSEDSPSKIIKNE